MNNKNGAGYAPETEDIPYDLYEENVPYDDQPDEQFDDLMESPGNEIKLSTGQNSPMLQ